jgi:hypothetical protein
MKGVELQKDVIMYTYKRKLDMFLGNNIIEDSFYTNE